MAEKGDADFKLQPFNLKSEDDILNKFPLPIKSEKLNSPEFTELMPDFSEPHNLSDIVLCIGDRRLHAHRAVLMQWSPVFKAMFSSDFQEKGAKQIPLPGKEYDEVLDLLCYIYPPCKQSITADNVRHMVKLADEYQIKFIKSECEQFLKESASHDNAMEYLYLAETFSLNDLQIRCLDLAKHLALKNIEESEYFGLINKSSIEQIKRDKIYLMENMILELNKNCQNNPYAQIYCQKCQQYSIAACSFCIEDVKTQLLN